MRRGGAGDRLRLSAIACAWAFALRVPLWGGRRVWENAGARVGFISAVVWGGAWVVGLGAGLGGISWRGKKTPAFPGFGSTLLES